MFKIEETQRPALRAAMLARFKASMVDHLRDFAPPRCQAAGDDGLTAFVDGNVDHALSLGLEMRGPVRMWLETGLVLGAGFDRDPQYAALMPGIDPAEMPMPYAEALHTNVIGFLRACFGKDKALLVRVIPEASMRELPRKGKPENFLLKITEEIWPEKQRFVGDAALRELAGVTDAAAEKADLTSTRGRLLSAMLGLSFGAHVLSDPLYPWLHQRVAADVPEPERIDRTLQAVRAYAKAAADRYRQGG